MGVAVVPLLNYAAVAHVLVRAFVPLLRSSHAVEAALSCPVYVPNTFLLARDDYPSSKGVIPYAGMLAVRVLSGAVVVLAFVSFLTSFIDPNLIIMKALCTTWVFGNT